ncbi:MAG TPA: polysaccharide biosynthesis/export family protein [Cyclobacteriaceae bacterium]|nr:polysaccharide biosynthesis/export family protein [Cyclobacteriaceae bacterium]
MRKHIYTTLLPVLAIGALACSCSTYKQNIMFKIPDGYKLEQEIQKAEKNYLIQKNDQLLVDVYTNDGERIIDPDLKLMENIPNQNQNIKPEVTYLVNLSGVVKLPMVGEIKLEGLTIREGEALLQDAYSKYYSKPFVVMKYVNKRVVVLGAPGGQVIPLANENVELVEILALAKGVDNNAKAHNIRVLRKEQVFLVDFSTVDGYIQGNMIMEPGDIVYVEPVRKPVSEAVRDYGPLVSLVASLVTLVIVIAQNN